MAGMDPICCCYWFCTQQRIDHFSLAYLFAKFLILINFIAHYNILKHRFHHGTNTAEKMKLHKMAMESVAVIVQYDMKYHPLFDVL